MFPLRLAGRFCDWRLFRRDVQNQRYLLWKVPPRNPGLRSGKHESARLLPALGVARGPEAFGERLRRFDVGRRAEREQRQRRCPGDDGAGKGVFRLSRPKGSQVARFDQRRPLGEPAGHVRHQRRSGHVHRLPIAQTEKRHRLGRGPLELAPAPLDHRQRGLAQCEAAVFLKLQVGRNMRQNDLISFKFSKKGDLWFHAQESPGSHVVLKSSSQVASEQDLQIAADLAALFSKAKRNIKVPINLVKIKDLQKIKKGGPGCVSFKNGEIIWGNPTRGEDYIKKNLKTVI